MAAVAVRWISLPSAADVLGLTADALRKTLDRRARKVADGGVEAEIDGVRARKLGRLWRVALGPAWCTPSPSDSARATMPPSQSPADRPEENPA